MPESTTEPTTPDAEATQDSDAPEIVAAADESQEVVAAAADDDSDDSSDDEDDDSGEVTARAWRGVLMIEGEPTSDGRLFEDMTWRELPLTMMWQKETSHGGMLMGGEVVVGRIDVIERDGITILGEGVFDLGSEDGREVVRLIEDGHLRGVSIEAAPADGEVFYDDENDVLVIRGAEIGAAAVVPFPAFRDAAIELLDEVVLASAFVAPETENVTASTAMMLGPAPEWFADPQLSARTGLRVEDSGRIYGHIYGWGECHQGFADRCVQIPRGGTYRYIVDVDGRGVRCSDGSFVQTGPLCISADHANTRLSWLAAKDHYAHTALAAADVVCGEDDHGIWVAGTVRPGTAPEMVHALTASAPSGDWRRVAGRLELVAILMVNMPGYPALVASFCDGDPTALILRGVNPAHSDACGCGGPNAQVNDVLEHMGRMERLLGPVVAKIRAEQAAEIERELAVLGEDDRLAAQPRRSLGELLAASTTAALD